MSSTSLRYNHTTTMEVKSLLLVINFVLAFLLLVVANESVANPVCPPGYTGNDCSTDIDDCATVNCSGQGNCSDRVDGYFCHCFIGFYGLNCEIDAGPCDPNPCKNNGSCLVDGGFVSCNCTSGYQGERCESAKLRNFTITLVMLDREYYSHYEDLTNFVTRGLIEDLTNIFEPFFKRNFPGFLEITFRAFSQAGRLGVTFDLSKKGASAVNESIIMQELQRGNGTRELRYEFLDFITVTEKQSPVVAQVSTLTGDDSASEMPDWVLILIIVALVIFILLVILIIMVVLLRRRRRYKAEKVPVPQSNDWNLRRVSRTDEI